MPQSTPYRAYRPTIQAPRGMAATPHYLASSAALRVLRAGGNAVDAAIAAAAVCSVVYPHMCSIGGDAFWLIYDARSTSVKALNGSGRSAATGTIDFYRKKTRGRVIPSRGFLAANTVPGAVDSWGQAHAYGQQYFDLSLPWSSLLDEAMAYAAQGYAVTPSQTHWTRRDTEDATNPHGRLQQWPGFARTYLKSDGRCYGPGEVMRQPDLARSLKAIAEGGSRVFYEGEVGERIVRYVQQHEGLLSRQDFTEHRSDWVTPIRSMYRGYDVLGFPPNTQGMAALQILNLLENFDLMAIGEGTADYYHLQTEATKLAFEDRDRWVTDPTFVSAPLEQLLSAAYARRRAGQIDMQTAARSMAHGLDRADTVYIATVDAAGNAVSMLQSVYFDFGSGIVAGDTGVLLQNRGSFFSLDPAQVNRLEPRKRTFHTLIPAMLLQGGELRLVYGTMGGEGQPQTQAALVSRIVDFGFGVQEAIEAPRWLYGRTWGSATRDLFLEGRIAPDIAEDLRRRGHSVRVVEDWDDTMGHAAAIRIDPETGMRQGGADPRGDGLAVGY